MKATIKFTVTKQQQEQREIELPCYRKRFIHADIQEMVAILDQKKAVNIYRSVSEVGEPNLYNSCNIKENVDIDKFFDAEWSEATREEFDELFAKCMEDYAQAACKFSDYLFTCQRCPTPDEVEMMQSERSVL